MDSAFDAIVRWICRVGIAWCVVGLLIWAWRGNFVWVGFYAFWLVLNVHLHRRMQRSRDRYLLHEAELLYEIERRERGEA